MESMLSPYRVLDLTDDRGYLCGKILADLGADVIKVEPPSGDPGRRLGPFFKDTPHPEKSFYWWAYNGNKRGITLNLETADGREILKRLVKGADFLVESFAPGYLDSLGMGYQALRQITPGLIMGSISGFGQAGPYANYKAPDIVVAAMGGQMWATGDPDRPPVRVGFPQSYLLASAEAAAGMLIALRHRRRTGEGQHVDASAQQCMTIFTGSGVAFWLLQRALLPRVGARRVGWAARASLRQLWPCKDGLVAFTIIGGPTGARSNRPLTQWMEAEGFADELVTGINWDEFDLGTLTTEALEPLESRIQRFFMAHTKMELYEGAIKRHIMLYPVATPKDLLQNAQQQFREFWVDQEHAELGTSVTYPGAFMKSTETPWRLERRAPLIGEHNLEVYTELGLTREDLVRLKQCGCI